MSTNIDTGEALEIIDDLVTEINDQLATIGTSENRLHLGVDFDGEGNACVEIQRITGTDERSECGMKPLCMGASVHEANAWLEGFKASLNFNL